MLTAYATDRKKIYEEKTEAFPANVVWIDMLGPTVQEETRVEHALKIDVPTREEMKGIEISNRLYREDEALFMTAGVLAGSDTSDPKSFPVTFILLQHKLITIRYHEPRAFQMFITRAQRGLNACETGEDILIGLLETIVDRLSDPLEEMAVDMDALSRNIFQDQDNSKKDFNILLRTIGQKADLNSKVKETLVGLDRLVSFFSYHLQNTTKPKKDHPNRLETLAQDIHSLNEHTVFLSNKINFLLQAVLGMISIEQNAIIKFFSVAAVIFLPPTLIASAYGMNFHHMPELDWTFGYPAALAAMLTSAILPYLYFKYKKWL